MKKKLLSWLLIMIMAMGLLPTTAFAETEYDTLIESIEEAYASRDLSQNWENVGLIDVEFSATKKNVAALAAIEAISGESPYASSVMKGIFTLASLGYDPAKITLEDDSTVNGVAVLEDSSGDTTGEYYHYTAPFVNLAFGVTDSHGVDITENEEVYIAYLKEKLGDDSSFIYGMEAPAMIIMGLAPYYAEEEVKDAVDEALLTIANGIKEGGTYGDSNTDAMVILAYAMLGIDPATIEKEGTNLVEGFLAYQCTDGSGFGREDADLDEYSTLQGLLALKALAEFTETGKAVNPFDFSDAELVAIDADDVQPDDTDSGNGDNDGNTGDAGEEIYVTVNISDNGEFVTGKNEISVVGVEVTLDGTEDATYDIDGVLKQAHALYYDGDDGYDSSEGSWGLSLNKLWGDTSYNFGYYLDGESAGGLGDVVSDGSVVDAYIYGGSWLDGTSESYSKFETISSATVGKSVTVTLKQESYDADWNPIFTGCEGATIYMDGVSTGVITDANGQATITFPTVGSHWLTAKKDADDNGITDIVAPYTQVTVKSSTTGGGSGDSSDDTIDVTFTVEADDRTWFSEDLELDEDSTAKDAFLAAFDEHSDYSYEIDGGSYVESITHPSYGTYGEFTHGSNSGWKYSVNDEVYEVAFSSYTLDDDDEVVFYYVMDYTTDSTGSSSSSSGTEEETTEEIEEAEVVSDELDEGADPLVVADFADVAEEDWFYSAVAYALTNGLFYGTEENSFAPYDTMTRAMVWTVLARVAGAEMNADADAIWYQMGLDWAMDAGISDGTNPDGGVTREELAAMLYRYEKSLGGEFTEDFELAMEYDDMEEVSDWAKEAICWMVTNGIIAGTSETTLSPKNNATRAEVAAILMRYLERQEEKQENEDDTQN